MVAFHVDQWRETGKVSRFAYDEARMEALLRRLGFVPEIESAEGNVITILDDDNLWDPDHLGNIVRDFNDADLVYKVCASRPSLLPVK